MNILRYKFSFIYFSVKVESTVHGGIGCGLCAQCPTDALWLERNAITEHHVIRKLHIKQTRT